MEFTIVAEMVWHVLVSAVCIHYVFERLFGRNNNKED